MICIFLKPIYAVYDQLEKSLTMLQYRLKALHSGLIQQEQAIAIVPFDKNNKDHLACVRDICNKDYKVLVSQAVAEKKLSEEEIKKLYSKECEEYFLENKFKFILTVDRNPAGFIGYFDKYNPEVDEKCHIDILGIKQEYKKRGLGTILINHAIRDLTEKGCDEISLFVMKKNKGAKRLYRKFHFVRSRKIEDELLRMIRGSKQ